MNSDWIDDEGFRANVGIILTDDRGKLMIAGRVGSKGWQFPQGGMLRGEDAEEAMFRELHEEVGLEQSDVELLGVTSDWLRYRLPEKYVRKNSMPLCIGQKQRWFMLRVLCGESDFCLDWSEKPEFDHWRWVRYWYPVDRVVYFKRGVYARALKELAPLVFPEGVPRRKPVRPARRRPRHQRAVARG